MDEQQTLLLSLQQGYTLEVHRTLDGDKTYQLHAADNQVVAVVSADLVFQLEKRGWIQSNLKFPVAVFLLTEKGRCTACTRTTSLHFDSKTPH
jgi:hypothetical protein